MDDRIQNRGLSWEDRKVICQGQRQKVLSLKGRNLQNVWDVGEDGGKEWYLVAGRQHELNSIPNPPASHGPLMTVVFWSKREKYSGGRVVKWRWSANVDREERRCWLKGETLSVVPRWMAMGPGGRSAAAVVHAWCSSGALRTGSENGMGTWKKEVLGRGS